MSKKDTRDRSEYQKAWYKANKERHNANVKLNHIKLKREVINHYGGKCMCCGETELDFMALDHINNNGARHREELGIGNGTRFYSWVKKNNFPKDIQVLCHNCNFSKHINGGICIHKLNEQAAETVVQH